MELFDFQRKAVTKLAAVPARLIGDEMGLGKTVTAIALDIEARKRFKETYPGYRSPPTLVVAPMSVLSSWADHFADWAPHLKVLVIDRKDRPAFIKAVEDKTYDVYICHWDVLRLIPQLNMRKWLHIIGDEIHRISSRNSQLTNAFRLIRAEWKTGMSGTPMQTRPQDLWSPLNWLYPRQFTSYWRFFKRHVVYTHHTAGPCQADGCFKLHKNAYRELQGVANASELKTVMQPFFVRRLKEEVAPELPDKYYSVIRVGLDPKQRKDLGAKIVKALQKIGYTNAGTVEFLMDEDGSLYFIEMNTRIQVEHPVTELVTGVDLIKAQIRIAAGEKMEDATGEIHYSGHAIECRINAEDPETFVPSAGRITTFQAPGGTGVRVDSAAYADAVIPPYYDSMIAKLIVKGRDRAEAIGRMKRALEMFVIEGIKTSIPLHRRILADPDFASGKFDTHFIERLLGTNGK